MKTALFSAMLIVSASLVHAQESPEYRVSGGLIAGGVLQPSGVTACGSSESGWGAQIGISRRVFPNMEIQANGSAIREIEDHCIYLLVPREPGVYVDPIYGKIITDELLFSADLRARVHTNARISAELAGGAGWAFGRNIPYGVIAGGLQFGRGERFGIGAEVRAYRAPHELRVSVLPVSGPAQVTRRDIGHAWRLAPFFTLFISVDIGSN